MNYRMCNCVTLPTVQCVLVWSLLARSASNERSRMTQIISTNIHKLTQNGNLLLTAYVVIFNSQFLFV